MQDYELARGVPFDATEQRAAAAAAAWTVAVNARWETAMRPGLVDGAATAPPSSRICAPAPVVLPAVVRFDKGP